MLVGIIYEKRKTRQISELSGIQKSAPVLAGTFTLVMLSSIGLPGLNGLLESFLFFSALSQHINGGLLLLQLALFLLHCIFFGLTREFSMGQRMEIQHLI